MVSRDASLNPTQLGVLAWVRDGCPSGVYEGWSHRVTARALQHRGLIHVQGHGPSWVATIEPAGAYYLEHGTYQRDAEPSNKRTVRVRPTVKAKPSRDEVAAGKGSVSTRPRTARLKPGVTERFVSELADVGTAGVAIPTEKIGLFRRRVLDAERDGRVPEGKRIAFRPDVDGETRGGRAWLERVPDWHRLALRTRGFKAAERSAAAQQLDDSEAFQVDGAPRQRALRLVDALVRGGESEGMSVKADLGARVDRGRSQRDLRRDVLVFAIKPDEVRLWFEQGTVQVRHEPTARELKRARLGYLFPDFDEVPDENLTITLEGRFGTLWADSWRDTEQQRLEQVLPRIVEEILFRLAASVAARAETQRREEARLLELERRRHEWDKARERAGEAYRDRFLLNEMLDQAQAWRRASELQRYADAIRVDAEALDSEQRKPALEWADAIDAQAKRINPLPAHAVAPTPPEPSNEDLKPFMGRHGTWRP